PSYPHIPETSTLSLHDALPIFTDPELLVQWMGPRKYVMEIDRYELRDGGTWRYVHRDADGNEFGFHGVFHGTPSPDGMVQTFELDRKSTRLNSSHLGISYAVFC